MQEILGRDVNVKLETKTGQVVKGQCIATELNFTSHSLPYYKIGDPSSYFTRGTMEWELLLRGTGELLLSPQLVGFYEKAFTSLEWRCEWCSSVNSKERMGCKQCGAPRTFLYELMQYAATKW